MKHLLYIALSCNKLVLIKQRESTLNVYWISHYCYKHFTKKLCALRDVPELFA